MVAERMKIEEVRNVDVLHAELIRLAAIVRAARLVVVDFDALNLKANVAVLDSTIELRVTVDKVDCGDMVRNERENLFLRFLIDYCSSIRIVVLQE